MKPHNKDKRLKKRQQAYEQMIQSEPGLKKSFVKPGSLKK